MTLKLNIKFLYLIPTRLASTRMAATPKKLVHWELDDSSISALNSPFFNNSCESSVVSTSSLEFINSQLVAHGFVPSPGLSLDGISNDDLTRVVKCLLGMLNQRVVSVSCKHFTLMM